MPNPKTLFGTSRDVPLKGERKWGNSMTGVVEDLIDGVDGTSLLLSSGVTLAKLESTDTTIADAATLTPTHPIHRIQGSGGAVTLDATAAIADGSIDGQLLILQGVSDTNTVTIEDAANTKMNGQAFLNDGASITFIWDSTNSLWREQTRNN